MSATVLAFPAQAVCDSCQRATIEDDLDGCFTCDVRHCGRCLDSDCDCDKAIAELAARMKEAKGVQRRAFWRKVRARLGVAA